MKARIGFSFAAIFVAACGGDDNNRADAGANIDGGAGGCTNQLVEADYGDLGAAQGFADVFDYSGEGDSRIAIMPLNDDPLSDFLQLELYAGAGAFSDGEVTTGTFQITGPELQYETCGVCVKIRVDTEVVGGNLSYEQEYLATGGTVTVSSINGRLTGSMSNITFERVQIEYPSGHSTPTPDGCESNLDGVTFDYAIAAHNVPDAGTTTPDAGETTADAATPTADAAAPTPDALIELPDATLPLADAAIP
jgi:hypothetical protein